MIIVKLQYLSNIWHLNWEFVGLSFLKCICRSSWWAKHNFGALLLLPAQLQVQLGVWIQNFTQMNWDCVTFVCNATHKI